MFNYNHKKVLVHDLEPSSKMKCTVTWFCVGRAIRYAKYFLKTFLLFFFFKFILKLKRKCMVTCVNLQFSLESSLNNARKTDIRAFSSRLKGKICVSVITSTRCILCPYTVKNIGKYEMTVLQKVVSVYTFSQTATAATRRSNIT